MGSELLRLLTNRFALVERTFDLIPTYIRISMPQLCFLVALQVLTCFLLYGMAKKQSNSLRGGKIKHFDMTGTVMFLQTFLLTFLESALLFERHDSIGTTLSMGGVTDSDPIYHPLFVFISSVLCTCLSWRLKQTYVVGDLNCLLTISLACSKLISVVLYSYVGNVTLQHHDYLVIMMSSWFLLFVVSTPFYIYQRPIQPQLRRNFDQRKKSVVSGQKISKEAEKFIMIYCGLVLPFATFIFIVQLLWPLLDLLISEESEHYYDVSTLPSEFVGYSLSFWGLCTLSVLSKILPFGGAEGWRKASTSAILLGLCTLLVTPTSFVEQNDSSVFASISSVISTKEGSKGGWGFILAASSVLLALAGPLDLRDRKNKNFHGRLSVFFLIFNSGVSWMFTMQLLDECLFFEKIVVLLASLIIAFITSGLSVIFSTTNKRHFGEVRKKVRIGIIGYMGVLFIVIVLLQGAELTAFGRGGWLSVLIFILGLSFLLQSVVLRFHAIKVERREIGDLRNQFCFASWFLFVTMAFCSFRLSVSDLLII